MSKNHLIIGIGGTGGKIIREFRKTIFQQFRKEAPDGVNVGYLYVDSSDADMAPDNEDWKTLGTSVQLSKQSQLLIREGDLSARLDSVNQFPGIKRWIGSRDIWAPYLKTIQGTKAAAGQRRRLGRFLFACNVAQFKKAVALQVSELQRRGNDTVITFHVCCGLAGGTGSGSLVDSIAQLRAMYGSNRDHRIIVYSLLPEEKPNPNWALSGYYHANGYAALLELNAISAGSWEPHDLAGEVERLPLSDPFNACYVFTNENANGVPVDVDKEIPTIVADFLFQKIVAVEAANWGALERWENAENGDSTPETEGKNSAGKRSKRFMAFGIKRVAFPEEEITEYLTYAFARQACLQLRYNNWTDERGFIDAERNLDFGEWIRQPENLSRWKITDEHLCLSQGVLTEEQGNKKWKPVDEDWRTMMPVLKKLASDNPDMNKLDVLAVLCEKRFTTDYRGMGVDGFYKTKLQSRREHAKHVRGIIEEELMADWKNGKRSIFEISKLLTVLREYLATRPAAFGVKLVEARDSIEREAKNIETNQREWAKVGWIPSLMGKLERVFDAQATCLQTSYICKTRLQAYTFAVKLTEELIAELDDLKGEVDRSAALVSNAIDTYNKGMDERCKDPVDRFDYKKQLIRFYNSDVVRKVTTTLTKNETEQTTQAGRVRTVLLEPIGERPTFKLFNERIDRQVFLDLLGKQCKENAEIAHNNLVTTARDKVLNVNVLDKLKERFADDQQLRVFATDLVKHAGNFALPNEAEQRNSKAGDPSSICISCFSVILPTSSDPFSNRLKEAFRRSSGDTVSFIETSRRPNEICMVSLTNLMPLRTLRIVEFLRGRYELAVNGSKAAEARTFLHLEGDGSQYPSLYTASASENENDAIPYLLLAKAVGLLQEARSQTLGKTVLFLIINDENGVEIDQVELGSSIIESLEKVDDTICDKLRKEVEKQLATVPFPRDELVKQVVAEVKAIKVLRNNDSFDPLYKRFADGAVKANNRLKQG
jgi:hypothetical protein